MMVQVGWGSGVGGETVGVLGVGEGGRYGELGGGESQHAWVR